MECLPLGNQIRELEARVFKDCSKLRELSLSYNSITRIDSEAFRNVGDTMESLEISFGLKMKAFPGKLEMHIAHNANTHCPIVQMIFAFLMSPSQFFG